LLLAFAQVSGRAAQRRMNFLDRSNSLDPDALVAAAAG
jgi:hypothetical protein